MDVQEVALRVIDWNELAQDRDRWRTVVNVDLNCRVV
jgi:hypothetical protein